MFFPSARTPRGDRPMSDNAVLAALRRLGIGKEEMTGHGFRAMARTLLDEVLGFRPDYHRTPTGSRCAGSPRARLQPHGSLAGTAKDDASVG